MSKVHPEVGVSAPLCLVVSAPDGTQSIAVLTPGTSYSIGHSAASDIRIDDPMVSENHAVIHGGDPAVIVDLGSEHGTVVSGEVLHPRVHHLVTQDSVVLLGQTVVRFARSHTSGTHRIDAPSLAPESGAYRWSSVPPRLSSGEAESPMRSRVMRRLHSLAGLVAASNVSVLILGETGVGKEVMAHMIHDRSPRKDRPFVSLNCAAIPENLLESELFGHERGAFSGAVAAKAGIFETAEGSTLFLDEIGDLPLSSQAKILRVLDTGEVQRLGAVRPYRVDVRVIAATNRDIHAEIVEGRFRSDLFYRLNGMTIAIPPLRERVEDIVPLSVTLAGELSDDALPRFSPAAVARLQAHPWPGNVRELRTVIHRALLLARGAEIDVPHLVFDSLAPARPTLKSPPAERVHERFTTSEPPTAAVAAKLHAELEDRERRKIARALEQAGGSQKGAAVLLGVSRRTLINRLDRLGMPRPRKRIASKGPSAQRKPTEASSWAPSSRKGRR
jgi:DNA-binding NtrC family response regulator